VATGWTEARAVRNKAQRWVHEAMVGVAAHLPFPLLGLDCDNGAEFINAHLFAWCAANDVTFTRSRPYRKNDNCFVEQKNWPVVRQQVGYARYDTPRELTLLNDLYGHLGPYVNFFQPQMRLVHKTRDGAKVIKRYDTARTPYRRALASPDVDASAKEALTATYRELNPCGAQTTDRSLPGSAPGVQSEQTRAGEGGGAPTRSPLPDDHVLEAAFADIFDESTDRLFADILT
jgi:hypothetical protein